MGGRGASSASGTIVSNGSNLDRNLIRRANDASFVSDGGDRINRTYKRNVAEINSMALSNEEKRTAINEQRVLAEAALKAIAENPNPFVTGRARLNTTKTRNGADKKLSAENALSVNLSKYREQSDRRVKEQKQKQRVEIIQAALKRGDLSVVIDGVTWARKTKRSRSFTRVD